MSAVNYVGGAFGNIFDINIEEAGPVSPVEVIYTQMAKEYNASHTNCLETQNKTTDTRCVGDPQRTLKRPITGKS